MKSSVQPYVLTLTEPVRVPTRGPAQFRLRACSGQVFTVGASTNLTTWNALATVTHLTGTVEFTDPQAALPAPRFYRVSQP